MYNIKTSVIMKSFMNFNKVAVTMLITSSLFMACSDEISYNTVDTHYTANASNITNAGQAVDLGLPSGTKWANMNVGAASEKDNGILFVWGDITGTQVNATNAISYTDVTSTTALAELFDMYKGEEEKTGYLYDTLGVYKESYEISKYTLAKLDSIRDVTFDSLLVEYEGEKLELKISVDDEVYDVIANLIDSTEVKYYESVIGGFKEESGANIQGAPVYSICNDAKHDPATANWGSNWRMPTTDEVQELVSKCKWEFTGAGYTVTGPNGNSIFLPAAGYRYGEKWYGNGNAGYYASGDILGIYKFPSMKDQYKGSKGSIGTTDDMPNVLIFQYGKFDKSVNVYNNLSTSYGFSIRPVAN